METSQLPKMLKKLHLYTLLLCALISFGSYAQTYPISISTQLSQPSPIYLSNYADATTINSPIKIQLVLNDLTISNRQVRLKIYFQGNGISFSTNDFVVGSRPLYLEGGFPLQLTNVDLAPYFEYQNLSGLNPNQYAQPLPEGIYNIYVEVYDFATGKKLSNKTGSTTIIFQNDPPFLNLPLHNASIMQQNIQNIIFSWTPRSINVSNVEYEFSLVEIWDKYTPIQNAFAYSPPLYTATTRTTTLQYGINEPQLIPGKKYAWRIKAKAILGAEEIGVFKNNGYSEIFSFDYEIFCTAPLAIKTSGVSENQAKIEWSGNIDNYDYQVNYREKNANSEWYKQVTPRENITLSNLKPNTNYEYTVGSSCDVGKYTHSTVKEFTTIARDEIAFASCGIKPDPNDLTNTTPLPELFPNDVVSAGDFPIVVIKATGSNGTFSGEGYVTFPFLEKFRKLIDATDNLQGIANKGAEIVGKVSTAANASANLASNASDKVSSRLDNPTANSISNSTENAQGKVADIGAKVNEKAGDIAADIGKYETNIGEYTRVRITFNNIGINTDFKLISGEIIASYDPEWKGIADLDKVFDKVFGSDGIPIEGKFDYEVIDVKLNADGSTTIIGKDGQTSTIAKSPYERVYTDSTGKVITIPANGAGAPNITTGATGGKATAANTNGMSANGEVIQISSADVKITFKNGDDSKYAFDVKPDFASQKLLATYETIPMKDGGVYYVDYKAVSDIYDAKKFPEAIIAKAEFKNGKTKDDIIFKTNAGAQVNFEWKNDDTAIITVEKTLNFSKESIIATVKGAKEKDPKDATKTIEGKSEIAGKINLWQLAQKPVINVTLLSVNGASTPSIDKAKEFLNDVYNTVGIKFEVTTANVEIEELPNVIQCGDSDIFNFYSDGQKKIIGNIESSSNFEYNDKTYYVIYTGKSGEENYKGFMPLGGQYAFVFKNGNLKTAAHELGHGIFGLKHPFSNTSEAEKTDLLMDYKEGTLLSHNDWDIIHSGGWKFYGFQKSSSGAQIAKGFNYIMPNHKSFRFQTNDGKKDSDIINVDHINNGGHPNGTLYAFTINGKEYEFGFDSKKTTEAFYEKGSDIPYTNAYSKSFEEQNYRLLIQQAANSCNYYLAVRKKPNLLNPVLTILPGEVPETANNCSKILLNETSINGGTIDCSLIAEIKIDNPGSIAFRVNRAVKECLQAIETAERVSMINALLPYLGNIEDSKSKTALETMNREIGDTKNFVSNFFNAGDQYDVGRAIARLTSTGVENNDFQREIINIVKKNNYALLVKMLGECDFDEVTHPFIDEVSIAFMANPNAATTTKTIQVLGETLTYPSSLMPYIIGLKPNESISSDKDQLNAQYTVLNKLPITFNSNGTINLKESYSEYFKGKGIDDMTFPSLYDNPTADPFEATIFLIGIDNNELGLQKDKVLVMPAIWGFCIEKVITEHKKARVWRHVGNGAAVIGAIVSAAPSGGTSIVGAIALLGGEIAVLDELMMLSKDGVTFEQYQSNKELYEKWDVVYNSVMLADGLVNAPELAKTLGGLLQRMRSISYLKSAGKYLKPEFVTSLKLALQDVGKYKNIAAIKLGIKNTINYTKFAFKSTDNYIDIIIHAKDNKFYVVVEGVVQEKSSREIISIIDNVPTGKTARLLSCNDEAAAIALSIETKKPFYASDGWVEINKNGDVFSQKDFYLYNKGTKGAKGSNYTKGNAPDGIDFLRLGDGVQGAGNAGLLTKLNSYASLKTWVNTLDDVADAKLISKLDNYIYSNPTKLQKLEDVLNAPVLKNQQWDDLESVFDAFKKAESKGISVGHKKFPAVDDEGSSSFVLKNAKQYQAEASGDAALSLEKAGTSWDNIDDTGKLIDRKYGHGASIFKEVDDGFGGKIISISNNTRAQSILDQAKRQVNAAGGTSIKWEISTELGAKGIRYLFDLPANAALKNIDVVYVPQVKIIN